MKAKNKSRIAIVILVISILVTISFIRYLDYKHNWYVPEYPTEALDNEVFYTIDPATILTSLDQGNTDVFKTIPADSENYLEWPAGSFALTQNELRKIMNALHQFIWNEPLDDWRLIRASFLMDQCRNISGGFDYASMFYFQRKKDINGDNYIVHGLKVNLLNGEVSAGERNFNYTGKWKSLDLDKVIINNADLALSIAEKQGGEEARLAVQETCNRIDIFLAHERFEHDFLARPFNRYDYGWDITYWNEDGTVLLFRIVIDPVTGKYKAMNSK